MRRGRRYSYSSKRRIYNPRKKIRIKITVSLIFVLLLLIFLHITGFDRVKKVVVYNKPDRWNAKCDSMVGLGKYIWNANVEEEELAVEFESMYRIERMPSFIWYKRYKFVEKYPVGRMNGNLIGFDGSIIRKVTSADTVYPIINSIGKIELDDPVIQSFLCKLPEFAHMFDTIWISYDVIKGHLSFDKGKIYVLFMPSQDAEYIENTVVSTLKSIDKDIKKTRTIDLRFRGQVVLK